MPDRIAHAQERRVITALILDLIAISNALNAEDGMMHVDLYVIGCAVLMGQLENRPMNARKISHYVGAPRSTVIRKLQQLMESGVVVKAEGNTFRIDPDWLNRSMPRSKLDRLKRRILRSAVELNKLSKVG
ncbi:MAG: hypothetical protein KDK08_05890 [Rhizobiaceae bacterium]|nr:hypothetical protein [Rhizobiaceae bacterium]